MRGLMRVRLPRILDKQLNADGVTLKERARLNPVNVRITLNVDPLSTVEIRIPERDPDVAIHDFAEVYNQHGSVGIYRVVGIQPDYGKGRVLSLNHALDMLNDAVYPGDEKFDGTVTAYLTKLLNAQKQKLNGQNYWQLGTVEDTGTWSQELSYDNVLELVQEIPAEHQEYMYTYDFSVFPWRLNLVRKPDVVLSEFRANRNIESCKVSVDDSELCTKLHMSVTTYTESSSGRKSAVTFETHDDLTAQAEYDIVEKTVGIDTDKVPASQKAAWIADYFQRHNAPTVQISIDGADLKEQTGVSIDEMHLGYLCRVALPRYNTLFNERIVTITYPDALRRPTLVSVALANKRQTTEDSIASAQKEAKKASKAGGGAKKKADNNETTIKENQVIYNRTLEATDKRVRSTMTATGVLLDENNEPLIGPDGLYVFDTTGPGAALSSRITQMAGKLESEITARTAQGESLSSRITQNANAITMKVSAGDIASTINQTAQSVLIQANKINLEGYVTATTLKSAIGDIAELETNNLLADYIGIGSAGMNVSGDIVCGGTLDANSVDTAELIVGGTDCSLLGDAVDGFGTVTATGGQISIPYTTLAGGAGTINFNIADTQFYQDGVSAAEESGWRQAGNAVTAAWPSPQTGSHLMLIPYPSLAKGSLSYMSYGVRCDNSYAYIYNANDQVVARVENPKPDGTITAVSLRPNASVVYDQTEKEYTVPLRVTGSNISNSPYDAGTVHVSGSDAYNHGHTVGVAEGEAKFEQVTVTPQGDAYGSITPINSGSAMHLGAATTIRPCSGSGITPTLAKVKVATSNGTYYLRKTSAIKLKHWGSQTFYAAPTTGATSYNHDWYYIDTGGTNYYQSDGTATKYSVADASFYDVGSSNAGKTLYEGGTSNTYRQVLDSGGTTFYTAGTAVANLRKPGTADSTTYFKRKATT